MLGPAGPAGSMPVGRSGAPVERWDRYFARVALLHERGWPQVWQNRLNYSGSSALMITVQPQLA
jgi:hypothetical protein